MICLPFIVRLVLPALGVLFSTGCVTPAPLPRAQESAYFRTMDSGFHIFTREGSIRYAITLEPTGLAGGDLFYRVRYENPADPGEPFVEEGEWQAKEESLVLQSPPLIGLEADKLYRVEIDLFDSRDRTDVLDRHEVLIFSNIDTRSHGW